MIPVVVEVWVFAMKEQINRTIALTICLLSASALIFGQNPKKPPKNDEAVITSASGQIGFLQQLTDNKVVLRTAVDRIKARQYYVRDTERPLMTEYQAIQIDRAPVAMNPNGIYLGDIFEYFVQRYIA